MTVKALACPACGGSVPPEETVWFWGDKIYCSESCCRKAAFNR